MINVNNIVIDVSEAQYNAGFVQYFRLIKMHGQVIGNNKVDEIINNSQDFGYIYGINDASRIYARLLYLK